MTIEVRAALYIKESDLPAGPRLLAEQGPKINFNFPMTPEGIEQAEAACERLNNYLARPDIFKLQHRKK